MHLNKGGLWCRKWEEILKIDRGDVDKRSKVTGWVLFIMTQWLSREEEIREWFGLEGK